MGQDFRILGRVVKGDLNRVVAGDRTFQVEPKVLEVLLRLAQTPGGLVSREDLLRDVWRGTFVSDDVLTRCVGELRRLFDDDARRPRLIETIHKKGYRLIAHPQWEARGTDAVERPAGGPAAERAVPSRLALGTLALSAVCLGAGAAVVWLRATPDAPKQTRTFLLTSDRGRELGPSMSPDGQRIAFAAAGEQGDDDLFVRLVNSETPFRLTTDPAADRHPAWSPDGTRIAFFRERNGRCDVMLVPALGGPEQRLAACGDEYHSLAWSPDQRFVALAHREGTGPWRLRRVAVDGSTTLDLPPPPEPFLGDHTPAFSPDGESVVFIRSMASNSEDIYVRATDGRGEARRLTYDYRDIAGLDLWNDGGSVVFASNRAGTYSLWTVPLSGGEPRWLAGGGQKLKNPSAARHAPSLACEVWSYAKSLWAQELGTGAGAPRPLTTSNEWDQQAELSPDGSRLAFVSTRSGGSEIWLARADGSASHRLTSLGGPDLSTPRWSPDATRLVFAARPEGQADLYVVEANGSPARRLTADPGDEVAPSWSRDGRFVYFGSRRSGAWEVWKLPAAGGQARRVTTEGAFFARESLDGGSLYFTRSDRPGLFRRGANGGAEVPVLPELPTAAWADWDVTSTAAYAVRRAPAGDYEVVRHDFATGRDAAVAWLGPEFVSAGLSVSGDGRRLVYTRADRAEADIMVMEHP